MGNQHFEFGHLGNYRALGGLGLNVPLTPQERREGAFSYLDFDISAVSTGAVTTMFTTNAIGAPTSATILTSSANGGVLVVTAGTGDDTGTSFEAVNSTIVPATGRKFAFGARFKKDDANAGAMWIGLSAILGATDMIHATNDTLDIVNGIGFWTPVTSAAMTVEARRSSGSKTGTLAIATLADDTYVEVGFRVSVKTITSDTDNGIIEAFMYTGGRWVKIGNVSGTAIPNAALGLSAGLKNEPVATTHASIASIDYLWQWTERVL
jgi:hypothetical protein